MPRWIKFIFDVMVTTEDSHIVLEIGPDPAM